MTIKIKDNAAKELIVDADYPGLVDSDLYYSLDESLVSENSILIKLNKCLRVKGSIRSEGGITAGLGINRKRSPSFKLNLFCGTVPYKKFNEKDSLITCGKIEGGVVRYGTINEIGLSQIGIM